VITVTFTITDEGRQLVMKTGRVDHVNAPATPREVQIAKMACAHLDRFPQFFAEQTGAQLLELAIPRQPDGN
jgi:hypothetical protein